MQLRTKMVSPRADKGLDVAAAMDVSTGHMDRVFRDTEELSTVLSNVDVSAIQLSKGAFEARLHKHAVGDWCLQSIKFSAGMSSCSGSAAPDRFSFLIPMKLGPECRLLGKPLSHSSIGVYTPGSEHADVSGAGLSECVITAPPDFLERADRLEVPLQLPENGSDLFAADPDCVGVLSSVMSSTLSVFRNGSPGSEIARNLLDTLERSLHLVVGRTTEGAIPGRPKLSREVLRRKIALALEESEDDVLFPSEVARSCRVSQATLQRFFMEWFGISPSRYLLIKRLYLARRRLLSGDFTSVTDVATSCGFWELGRFSVRYRAQFGETPSETLRRGGA